MENILPLGREVDLVGQTFVKFDNLDLSKIQDVTNIVIFTDKPEHKWIEETSKKIGEWRAYFRSTYIRWALSINGLHIASEKYSNEDWNKEKQFTVKSIRMNGKQVEQSVIALWDGDYTSKAHLETVGMLNSWGLIDLCGCMEEFVFDFYKIFLTHHPNLLLKGDEFRQLKKLYKSVQSDPSKKDEWDLEFSKRLSSWQKKRLYDGLGKVFLSYCNEAGIKKPSGYESTNPTTWAESIEGIFLVRNALIHGMKNATKEIELFGLKPHSMVFKFKENDSLEIKLLHLQSVELFTHQLLTALNLSLLEKHKESNKKTS